MPETGAGDARSHCGQSARGASVTACGTASRRVREPDFETARTGSPPRRAPPFP